MKASCRKQRLLLASGLLRLHRFWDPPKKISSLIGSLLLTCLNPEELKEQVRSYYDFPEAFQDEYSRAGAGLSEEELYFVSTYLKGKKSCLVLGSGSGRESIELSKLGLEVRGIDSCPALVEKAKEEARRRSVECRFEVGNMFLFPGTATYDGVILTGNMYSAIPTRKRRIEFLKHTQTFLKADGFFYLEFLGETRLRRKRWKFRFKKWAAIFVNGNKDLEEGDVLYLPGHYFHLFRESEFLNEIEEGGFAAVALNKERACAVLSPKKRLTERDRGR